MRRRSALVLVLASALGAALAACANADYRAPDAATDASPADATDARSIDALDACAPASEQCNGRDDDCDTRVDEDFPTVGDPCSAGEGACLAMGHLRCASEGLGVECDATAGMPGTETCNGADDDCDTRTDEGFGLGMMCDGADGDMCHEGTFMCGGGGAVCSDTSGDTVETCNGLNDDCDGMTDEGFNLGMMCDGADTDQCREGVIQCNGMGGTRCSDTSGNNVEVCNNLDDDCDLTTDEGLGLGAMCDGPDTDACAEGMVVCGAGGMTACSDATTSTVETCNGVDDDCAGGVDNGFPVGQSCSVGVGACQRTGTNLCNAQGNGVVCSVTAGAPTAETCGDGIDQDCNGADVACPINDLPTAPVDITNGGTFTVDLTAARNDQEASGVSCGIAGGRDVFYRFTLPAAEVVYFDTLGSSFDTVVRIYPGACNAPPATPTCFDDQCSLRQSQGALQLPAGQHCLVVDQYSNTQTTGALVLTFTRGGRTGTSIAPVSGAQTGTSCSGTNASTGSCQTISTAQDTAYFFPLCPVTRMVGANTCTGTAHDSVVYLRKVGLTSDIACNDDTTGCGASGLQSTFTGAAATGPGLFFLIVDGYQAQCGNFTLNYTFQ